MTAYPELFRFVRDANREDSLFRTAGSDVVASGTDDAGWKYRSFIHLLFEVLHWNTSPKCYLTLFAEFESWVTRQQDRPADAGVLFKLGPTSFWDHSFDGCSLRVYVEGRGSSEGEARREWEKALLALSGFLEEFSKRHQQQLQNCAKRVS